MSEILYNYKFKFKDADGSFYKLREESITSAKVLYRKNGTTDSFTETFDYNLDEENDTMWCRLPSLGLTDLVININVKDLKVITTSLVTLDLVEETVEFDVTATPVPLNSLQGYSPRVINGYWHQYNDELQAFENTGIKCETAIVPTGSTVVDVVEQNNPNAVSSNAVYVSITELGNQVVNISSSVNTLSSKVNTLVNNPVKVKLNNETHEQDASGLIDLGTIEVSQLPDTSMLTGDTTINGTVYPKGTQVDSNNKVYSTDSLYYYSLSTVSDQRDAYRALCLISEGCKLQITYSVYMNSFYGEIYCVRDGYNWSAYTTSKEIANRFFLYRSNDVSSPMLISATTSQYVPGRVRLVSDKSLTVYDSTVFTPSSDRIFKIDPFITSQERDTVEIDTNEYSIDPQDLIISDFVVNVDGELDFTFTSELDSPVSLEFAITKDNTTIKVSDGSIESTSASLSAGSIATFIYNGGDNYYWNYGQSSSSKVTDVMVDNTSVVANNVAYINSFTEVQVSAIKSKFNTNS